MGKAKEILKKDTSPNKSLEISSNQLFLIVGITVLLAFIAPVLTKLNFLSEFGQWFGGFAGGVLAIATTALVYQTYQGQKKENQIALLESKRRDNEANFKLYLDLHMKIVDGKSNEISMIAKDLLFTVDVAHSYLTAYIKAIDPIVLFDVAYKFNYYGTIDHALEVLSLKLDYLKHYVAENRTEAHGDFDIFQMLYNVEKNILARNPNGQYQFIWGKASLVGNSATYTIPPNGFLMGKYFRNLYGAYRYLDSSVEDSNTKQELAKVLRRQLSDDELVILTFNSLSSLGAKFNDGESRLIYKYKLLKNLPIERFYKYKDFVKEYFYLSEFESPNQPQYGDQRIPYQEIINISSINSDSLRIV